MPTEHPTRHISRDQTKCFLQYLSLGNDNLVGASTSLQTETKGSVLAVVVQVFALKHPLELNLDSLVGD